MSKKNIFIAIGIFWLVIIIGFIGFKEFTLKTGVEVLLKTAPVDPRDLFRGDYVILRYDVSTIDTAALPSRAADFKVGEKIYALLDIGNDEIGKVVNISKEVPVKGVFLMGIVKDINGSEFIRRTG